MATRDLRGCAISGAAAAALPLYESGLRALGLQRGDPLAYAQRALEHAPGFVAARQLAASLLLYSRDPRDSVAGRAALRELAGLAANAREALHTRALHAAAAGDFAAARAHYDAVLLDQPRDALALWASQLIDYYLGEPHALRARVTRVLDAWSPDVPGYHAVVAMLAFGLEECGAYDEAAVAARRALELEPRDLRALHALVHVFEMQARAEEGVRFLRGRADLPNHLWWHAALFHLQLGDPAQALDLYDRHLRRESVSELIDASALLWRLWLAGIDPGARFEALAERWAPHAEDGYCAFNDLHAMMAFVGARRWPLAGRLLAAQERRLDERPGTNQDMTRLVGLPACRALAAYARGDFALADALLRSLPPVAHRLGGSHAQRDVLHLTRAAAFAARRNRFQGGIHEVSLAAA